MLDGNVYYENEPYVRNVSEWRDDIKEYDFKRTNVPWVNEHINPYPQYITQEYISKRDNIFNPITQKYYDNDINVHLSNNENIALKQAATVGYDNALRNEQTYDIINLRDKFKHFENSPTKDANIFHSKPKLNKEISKVNYNILSVRPLSEHHYNPPEKRPMFNDNLYNHYKLNSAHNMNKDYNIINNTYNDNNDLKLQTEKEIDLYTSAKRYFQNAQDDIIKGTYNDPTKENEIQKESERDLLQKRLRYKNGCNHNLINPINGSVIDIERQNEIDTKELNKKQRYKQRVNIEHYYKLVDDHRYLKNENSYKHKHSYFDEHIANNRGYDFISLVPKYKPCLTEVSDWDLIKDNSNENATFDKKQIYKGPYDRSDVMKNEMKYRQRRDDYIRQLPNVNDDDMFKPRIKLCKKNIQINNNDNLVNVGKSVVLDKRKWFGDKKSYLINEFDLNVINSNDDVGLRGQIMSNRLTESKMKKREFSSHF